MSDYFIRILAKRSGIFRGSYEGMGGGRGEDLGTMEGGRVEGGLEDARMLESVDVASIEPDWLPTIPTGYLFVSSLGSIPIF